MGSNFDVVGTIELANSGRSLKIILDNLPDTTFRRVFYSGREAVRDVCDGYKKTATVYILKPQERVSPAAKNPDL